MKKELVCVIQNTIYYLNTILKGEENEQTDMEAPKIYEPITSFEQLSERLLTFQQLYNEAIRGAKMDMVFFTVRCLIFKNL